MTRQRKMPLARAHELRRECIDDLEMAKFYGHKAWVETLTKRLEALKDLVAAAPDKPRTDQ